MRLSALIRRYERWLLLLLLDLFVAFLHLFAVTQPISEDREHRFSYINKQILTQRDLVKEKK